MKRNKKLEEILEIKFKNKKLLLEALTHRSYLNEAKQKGLQSNERLEFLGDSILSFVVSEWLFKKFPHYSEGWLTNFRSQLVKTETLAKIAKKFSLGEFLLLSRGEQQGKGRTNPVLLANAFEAIIGAIFLDQGIKTAKKFIHRSLNNLFLILSKKENLKDSKSLLQEKIQEKRKISPIYKIIKESGPDHAKVFTVGVFLKNKLLAKAQGRSKQIAEEVAAKKALKKIK